MSYLIRDMRKIIRYEYMTLRITSWRNENDYTDEQLTRFGMEGWELVSTYVTDGIVKGIFKRIVK